MADPHWADAAIATLATGQRARLQAFGNSMRGRIESGSTVTLAPALAWAIGDAVLCRVGGRVTLHIVHAFGDGQTIIANAHGHIDGPAEAIYGVVVDVEAPRE